MSPTDGELDVVEDEEEDDGAEMDNDVADILHPVAHLWVGQVHKTDKSPEKHQDLHNFADKLSWKCLPYHMTLIYQHSFEGEINHLHQIPHASLSSYHP